MSAEFPHVYEFGNFRLDTKEKVLFRDNKPVPLRPKVFATLQVFVEHPGHLLEKDELMQRIWKDQFVEESNLSFNIKVLRRVLDDDAHQPRFIETVPRRGYRFIADVKKNSASVVGKADSGGSLGPSPPTAFPPRIKRAYLSIAALAVLVLVGLSAVLWFVQRHHAASGLSAPILSK